MNKGRYAHNGKFIMFTGNITEDGRISRLIDEWSSDDDDELGIINDPGLGSGLSTPAAEPSG